MNFIKMNFIKIKYIKMSFIKIKGQNLNDLINRNIYSTSKTYINKHKFI